MPHVIDIDQGLHFTPTIVQKVAEAFNIKWDLHWPWHPQTEGQLERMSATVKLQLTKLCSAASLKWLDALLIVFNICIMPRGKLKLSP